MTSDTESLARRLSWLAGLRLVVLSALLGAIIVLYLRERQVVGDFSTQLVLATVAGGFALAALFAAALRARKWLMPIAYGQLVVDQITWTLLAYVSGGAASGAASFYGLTCVFGAVVAGVRGVIVTVSTAAVLFASMSLGFATGWLRPPADQVAHSYPLAWKDVSYHLSLNLLALVVVAVLAGYLAERLQRAGGQLIEVTARAEQAERLALLGKFAAGLAHEIRNPLGSIAGSVELLAMAPSLSEEDKILCGIITREASRLNDLVTDMLDLVRPRQPELQPVDVATLAGEVVRLAARSGRGSDVVVRYDGPRDGVLVRADAGQLRQILWNLVRNAVQVSSAGAPVSVRVRVEASGAVALEVEDAGPGIPDSAREQLFDAFFTTRTQGVGIGLAVVKRIVDDHGFGITVESGAERGALFRVVVPPASVEPAPPSSRGRLAGSDVSG